MEIEKLTKMVEKCLEKYPETRDSDITLTLKIWKEFYGISGVINVNQLYDLPREDNIKRWRAYIQNEEGRYLPTMWEVARKRGINREVWERALGYVPKLF